MTRFDLHIDANDVAWVREGEDYIGQLRLAVVHYLANGQTEILPIIPIDLHYNRPQREEALKDGIDFVRDVPIGKSGQQFRIIVFDRGSNAVGSITIPEYENSRVVLPQLNSR